MRLPYRLRSRRDRWLIALLLAPILVMGGGALITSALRDDVRAAYVDAIVRTGKEPAFFLTLAFLITFGVVRFITYSIHDGKRTLFRNVTTKSGLHIHHVVPGLILTLLSGYLGLVLPDPRSTRLLAVVFGVGAALALDEFALVLRLADVYWEPQGRESIDAVVLAGGIAVLYLLGFDFWPHLIEVLARSR
ncbi:MAG TPA: hypothetical protein VFU81_01925 [Thermomicrobiales bacterium]|nr:hypothetical protein [Thermomicrobiales bacterium]